MQNVASRLAAERSEVTGPHSWRLDAERLRGEAKDPQESEAGSKGTVWEMECHLTVRNRTPSVLAMISLSLSPEMTTRTGVDPCSHLLRIHGSPMWLRWSRNTCCLWRVSQWKATMITCFLRQTCCSQGLPCGTWSHRFSHFGSLKWSENGVLRDQNSGFMNVKRNTGSVYPMQDTVSLQQWAPPLSWKLVWFHEITKTDRRLQTDGGSPVTVTTDDLASQSLSPSVLVHVCFLVFFLLMMVMWCSGLKCGAVATVELGELSWDEQFVSRVNFRDDPSADGQIIYWSVSEGKCLRKEGFVDEWHHAWGHTWTAL